jgi:hypothetical protein
MQTQHEALAVRDQAIVRPEQLWARGVAFVDSPTMRKEQPADSKRRAAVTLKIEYLFRERSLLHR